MSRLRGSSWRCATSPGRASRWRARRPGDVLIEVIATGEPGAAEGAMERLLAEAMERGLVKATPRSPRRRRKPRRSGRCGRTSRRRRRARALPGSIDVAVPVSRIAEFLATASAALEARYVPEIRIDAFGHVGDGNIHFMTCSRRPGGDAGGAHNARRDEAAHLVHGIVMSLGGSISAEHGLGTMKTAEAACPARAPLRSPPSAPSAAALDPKRIA